MDVEDNIIFRDDGLDRVLGDDVDVDTTTVTAAEINNRDPVTSNATRESLCRSAFKTVTHIPFAFTHVIPFHATSC